MLSPVKLLPTRENLAALNVLAFLSAWSNPDAVNLLVLPPTICRASPKKPFYRVSVHGPRANALALYHTVDVHDRDVSQQQRFDSPTSDAAALDVDVPPPFALSGASPSLHA